MDRGSSRPPVAAVPSDDALSASDREFNSMLQTTLAGVAAVLDNIGSDV